MITASVFKRNLLDQISGSSINKNDSQPIRNVYIANQNVDILSDAVYICDKNAAENLISRNAQKIPLTLIISDSSDCPPFLKTDYPVNLITSPLDLLSLTNEVFKIFNKYYIWESRLRSGVENGISLQELSIIGSEFICSPFIICGEYGTLLAYSADAVSVSELSRVVEDGFVTPEKKPLLATHDFTKAPWSGGIEAETGKYRLTKVMRHANVVTATIVTIIDDLDNRQAVYNIVDTFSEFVEAALTISNSESYNSDAAYTALVSDLIEQRIFDKDQLAFRLRQCVNVHEHYCVALVASASSTMLMRYSYTIYQLKRFFTDSQVVQYKEHVILLIKCPAIGQMPNYNVDELNTILETFNARIAFSYPLNSLIGLASVYSQLKSILNVVPAISIAQNSRIIYFEKYYIYHIIDILMQSEEYSKRPSRLLFLCTPEFYKLKKYDYENNTSLCDMLLTYYRNDRNITQTANELFFHRNSIANKLDKIREIIGDSINEIGFQQRMMLSFSIYDYVTKYKNAEFQFR